MADKRLAFGVWTILDADPSWKVTADLEPSTIGYVPRFGRASGAERQTPNANAER